MYTMRLECFFVLMFFYLISLTECARILGVFPFPAKSHFILGDALMKGLANAGHDVTIIASHELKEHTKGKYRTVLMTGFPEKYMEILKDWNLLETDDVNSIYHPLNMQLLMFDIMEEVFKHLNVQNLLKSKEKFDVVIVEKFYSDAFLAFAYHFDAHQVLFSALGASPCINNIVGNPETYSYVPYFISTFPPEMSFLQRIHNSFLYGFQEMSDSFYFLPKQEVLMKKYFPNVPSLYDLYANVSLVFVNSHESYAQAVPLVPNVIPIGGFHIKKPKPLPADLQKILDEATEGVVYFSLGSNLKIKDFPLHKREALLNAFGKLKEKVLMKWEDDVLPNQPSNVITRKWMPQSDVLAHKNIKLSITHGGLLSTTEAIYHGLPILIIPVFADQHSNAQKTTLDGYALNLPYSDPEFGEEKISKLLHELLHNTKYRENANRRSKLFHDRPLTPIQTVNYWVDFVIKHNGAHHLRVAGADLPWYKYHLVDIIAFVLAIMLVLFYITYSCLRKIFRKTEKLKKT